MKKTLYVMGLLTVLAVFSCVTINIYFPAEEIRGAADKIVDEVWGEQLQSEPKSTPPPQQEQPDSTLLNWMQPNSAYAVQDIEVSTPEIRAIKTSIKQRSATLFPYLNSGHVGLSHNGLLKVRDTSGLNLKSRGEVNRLVKAENTDRLRLYQEIAVANGFPDKTDEVQNIFAASWREKAASGWYIEKSAGDWGKK